MGGLNPWDTLLRRSGTWHPARGGPYAGQQWWTFQTGEDNVSQWFQRCDGGSTTLCSIRVRHRRQNHHLGPWLYRSASAPTSESHAFSGRPARTGATRSRGSIMRDRHPRGASGLLAAAHMSSATGRNGPPPPGAHHTATCCTQTATPSVTSTSTPQALREFIQGLHAPSPYRFGWRPKCRQSYHAVYSGVVTTRLMRSGALCSHLRGQFTHPELGPGRVPQLDRFLARNALRSAPEPRQNPHTRCWGPCQVSRQPSVDVDSTAITRWPHTR